MFCSKCGEKIEKDDKFCIKCGADLSKNEEVKEEKKEDKKVVDTGVKIDGKPVVIEKPAEDGKATASLVLGICSIVVSCLALPLSIIGLILGIVSKEKSGKRTAGIIINSIMLALSIIVVAFFAIFAAMGYSVFEEVEKEFENEWNEVEKDIENNYEEEDDDTMYVGDSTYGYVKVPDTWLEFKDVDGNSSIQYTDVGDKGYIVTLNVINQNVEVSDATKAITDGIKSEGATAYSEPATGIGRYNGYVIHGTYPDGTYIDSYIFKAEGVIHFVSIEGPSKTSEHFDIPKTFTLEK